MALRGADVDPTLLRTGSIGVYLNQYYRTRAWVGTDERAYSPGDTVTGSAYLKHNPHPARRDLVLSQVDVYLAPECARRKRNYTHDARTHAAKRQNLADFYYLRRPGPAGSGTYRAYYDYGETIPPRENPFHGPFQAPYHWRALRFLGPDSAVDDSDADSSGSIAFDHAETSEHGSPSPSSLHGEPPLLRHCVFKAERDGGPRSLPGAHSETAFRYSLRLPDYAPEAFAWAEPKDGCVIEVRYRLFVVFKLRTAPRNPMLSLDPQFWEGAHRLGEAPLVVLFSENLVLVDSPRVPSIDRARAYALPTGFVRPYAERARLKRRSLWGRRMLSIDVPNTPCVIGEPINVRLFLRCRGLDSVAVSLKVEFVERAVLRHGRKMSSSASVHSILVQKEVDKDGMSEFEVDLRTDYGDVYPTAVLGGLSVVHSVRATLCPGERFSLAVRAPVVMTPGAGQYISRAVHNETLYPQQTRQPPWRRERSRRLEREKAKRENVAAMIDALPEAVITVEEGSDDEEEVCAICLDEMTAKRAVMLPCNHMLHEDCIKDWAFNKSECPICKTAIKSEE